MAPLHSVDDLKKLPARQRRKALREQLRAEIDAGTGPVNVSALARAVNDAADKQSRHRARSQHFRHGGDA